MEVPRSVTTAARYSMDLFTRASNAIVSTNFHNYCMLTTRSILGLCLARGIICFVEFSFQWFLRHHGQTKGVNITSG